MESIKMLQGKKTRVVAIASRNGEAFKIKAIRRQSQVRAQYPSVDIEAFGEKTKRLVLFGFTHHNDGGIGDLIEKLEKSGFSDIKIK